MPAAPHRQLGLAALTLALIVSVVLVAPNPLWAGHPSGPPTAEAPPAEPIGPLGLIVVGLFVFGLCAPFRPYRTALRALRHTDPLLSSAWLLGLTGLLAAVALLIFPAYGSDLFDYVGFERMWVVYGDNPLLAVPSTRPDDWATPLVWYATRTPAYGPLWAILTWPLVRLSGDAPSVAVLAYKGLALAGYVTCGWIIWHAVPGARRAAALLSFAWNPLVLFEVLGKVHNDILPALATVLAVWLATRPGRAHVLALAALAAGALVKVSTVASGTVILAATWQRSTRPAFVLACGAAGLVIVGLYLPFWVGPATLAPIGNQTTRLIWSPAALVLLVLSPLGGGSGGLLDTAVRALLALAWVLVAVSVAVRCSVELTVERVASGAAWLLIAAVLLLTGAVYAHYLVPVIAVTALADDPRLDRVVLWLSIGALAAYAVELLSLVFGPQWLGSPAASLVGSLVLLVPPGLALRRLPPSGRQRSGVTAA